jgi:hypothetical protein
MIDLSSRFSCVLCIMSEKVGVNATQKCVSLYQNTVVWYGGMVWYGTIPYHMCVTDTHNIM